MSTENITVEALATELGIVWRQVARSVSALCRELGPTNVVAEAVADRRQCVLHGTAADLIRDDLTTANT